MPSRSPAVQRAACVLRAVAEGRASTISGLGRELRISKTTCNSIVHELLASNLLSRAHPEGALQLGNGLASLGLSAIGEPLRAAGRASGALARLSSRVDASCVAATMCGQDMIIVGRCDPERPIEFDAPVGLSVLAVPPAGRDFMAWKSDFEIDAWLSRLGADATAEVRARQLARVDDIRQRGYSIFLDDPSFGGIAHLAAMIASLPDDDGELNDLLAALSRKLESRETELRLVELPQSRVRAVSAPVFDASGNVVLSVSLCNFSSAVHVDTVAPYADELLSVTRSLTKSMRQQSAPDFADQSMAVGHGVDQS